jgi:hypothetical protein
MFSKLLACVLLVTATASAADAATLVVNHKRIHLRSGDTPEWDWFTNAPDARRLDLTFTARSNRAPALLLVQQDDVRHDWRVELNGKRLGSLFLMEADVMHTLPIPTGALRNGTNKLSIVPPTKDNDDIILRRIAIEESAPKSTLAVEVSDASADESVPCRITIVDANDTLMPLFASSNAPLAVRPGVIYSGDGKARVSVFPGEYVVYASRGFEWSVATQRVHVAANVETRIALKIERQVDTRGFASCDTHVHTFTHSRHGDATTDERMLTLAGEGIELPIATDHNMQVDYIDPARRMRVNRYFTPVTGNEVTTSAGHFNIFPVELNARPPNYKITDWPELMEELRATPGVQVVVLNHPRNIHNNFQPFASSNYNNVTGENKRGPEFTFDAMELLNSSALQSDYMLVYRGWFALLNHGYRVTGVGSSDGHDVSRYIIGQGRTYIACDDSDPARIDVNTACSNLLAGRASVSLGLLATMTVNGQFQIGDLATNVGDQIKVSVRVLGPSWIAATNVELYANGVKIRELAIGSKASGRAGEKLVANWTLPRPSHDVHLVAIATGPGVSAPFWATARPYQPSSPHWEPRVTGSSNPIWVDADGDDKFTAARAYAKAVLTPKRDVAGVLSALSKFDESVAAQAAGLMMAAGTDLKSKMVEDALVNAAPAVKRGFTQALNEP